ncbi:hypothetical protein RJT34_31821 [Clitoria ternatea]|uniref:Uncharacterized protein n=1 Tax=Clitoria ternatea TaxID=43366 RepID=A0AAN9EVQ2_CLITE
MSVSKVAIYCPFKQEVICWKTSSLQGMPFGTCTDFEAAWLDVNDARRIAVSIYTKLGFRLPSIKKLASFSANQASSKVVNVPKGYLVVYVGDEMKRFLIPISYLNQPSFQDLLSQAEAEFGYNHPMGGLTIPCEEDVFLDIRSGLNRC